MTRCLPSPQQPDNVLRINIPEQMLDNLYARWLVVDRLIRSLEDYQQARPQGGGECLSFSAGSK